MHTHRTGKRSQQEQQPKVAKRVTFYPVPATAMIKPVRRVLFEITQCWEGVKLSIFPPHTQKPKQYHTRGFVDKHRSIQSN